MSIRRKLLLIIIILVMSTTLVLMMGVSILIYNQKITQNQNFINNASFNFQKDFTQILAQTAEQVLSYTKDTTRTTAFYASTIFNQADAALAITIGNLAKRLKAETLGFYAAGGDFKEEILRFYYFKDRGSFLVQLGSKHQHEFVKMDEDGFPSFEPVEETRVLSELYVPSKEHRQLLKQGGKLKLISQLKYINTLVQDPDNDMVKGERVGYFYLIQELETMIKESARRMSVEIIVYDKHGNFLNGTIDIPSMLLTDVSEASLIRMEDEKKIPYDVAVTSLQFEEETLGYLAIAVSHKRIIDTIWDTIFVLAGISLSVLLIIVLISLPLVAHLTKSVISLSDKFKEIAEGGGDLTHRLSIGAQDEFGQVAKHFNHFLKQISLLVLQQRNSATQLALVSEQQLSGSVELSVASNSVVYNAQETTETIKEINEEATSLGQQSKEISRYAETMDTMMKGTSSAVIQGVTAAQNMDRSMNNIAQNTHGIDKVLENIGKISKEINLLSVNAAIESAKAGEDGRGFAVVADRIHDLADLSKKDANEIKLITINNNQTIQEGLEYTEQIANSYKTMQEDVAQLSETFSQIQLISSAQNKRIFSINEFIEGLLLSQEHLNQALNKVNDQSISQKETSSQLQSLSTDLNKFVQAYKVDDQPEGLPFPNAFTPTDLE